jgi:hypothetical protein
MKLINYYYDDINRFLSIDFSLNEDGDDFYRSLEMEIEDIIYYSPDIIDDSDLSDIDKSFVRDVLNEYLKDNEPPEQLLL